MHPSAHEIIGLYERHAPAFDRNRGRHLIERSWLDRFCAAMPRGQPVLDLGCGGGEPMARYLIDAGLPVTGVDSSAALIANCRSRFPNHSWINQDMRRLNLGMTFGGILAWDSLFHLGYDNQRSMFDIFAAHATPGTALMFTSGPAHGETVGRFEGEDLYHASLAPEEYKALLALRGFQVMSHVIEDAGCGGHTVWLAKRAA